MPRPASSPALIGRRTQLDALREALSAVGRERGHVVLVGGEAGIGKTRLVDEFAASVTADPPGGRSVNVITGRCSEVAAGALPYLPILDLLDGLDGTGGGTERTARIRDELAGTTDDASPATGRSATFLALRNAAVQAAATADLVVFVDDLHWADRSTLELLAFVAPRLGDARVMLVLAYRSDELHRRHPLRPVLVELERAGCLAHLRLEPLTPGEVAVQLEAIAGAEVSAGRISRISALADGNPFYVEELAALDLASTGLPRSLSEVLATKLGRLSDETLAVVSAAALVGRDLDSGLLAAAMGLAPDVLRAGLGDAVERHVLEVAPDRRRYRFRHALLAEAVRDDLAPADRTGLHRRLAETLEARPELGAGSPAGAAAELAYHWTEAGDGARAFPCWVEAGRAAGAAHAWREAAAAFEQSLSLAAAGAIELVAGRQAELGMRAAMMTSFAGEPRRAFVLARAAMLADDESDPAASALRWADLSGLANDAGDWELERAASDRSFELMPAEPPSRALALVLVGHVESQMIRGAYRASILEGEAARRVCRAVEARDVELRLDASLSASLAELGHADAARSAARAVAEGIDSVDRAVPWGIGNTLINTLAGLVFAGWFEAALTFVDGVTRHAIDLEVERAWVPWFEELAALAAFHLGRWSEAAERLDRVPRDDLAGFPVWGMMIQRTLLEGATGRRSLSEAAADPGDGPSADLRGDYGTALALAALWAGDAAGAVRLADDAVAQTRGSEDVASTAWAVSVATRAWADMAESARAARRPADLDSALGRVGELAGIAASIAAATHLEGASATPWMLALCAACDAERLRAEGGPDPGAWRLVAAAFDALGTRPAAAYARYREAEAALGAGDRDAAAAALAAAAEVAAELGAVPLAGMVELLARRARIRLETDGTDSPPAIDPDPAVPTDPWGLSAREREVLALVSAGRTNREIGDALFISDKTASVHVTHILTKLGVASRTEAALLAARAGVAGSEAGGR